MRITITKEDKGDRLDVVRHDGTRAMSRFPRKGPTPHDAVHFLVEQELKFQHGFWGMVSSGLHPEQIADLAKAGGHASAKRATTPDGSIIELLQAERLVECFEASLWDGQLDLPAFRTVAQTACDSSQIPLPPLNDATIECVAGQVANLATRWGAAPVGERLELEWPQ